MNIDKVTCMKKSLSVYVLLVRLQFAQNFPGTDCGMLYPIKIYLHCNEKSTRLFS